MPCLSMSRNDIAQTHQAHFTHSTSLSVMDSNLSFPSVEWFDGKETTMEKGLEPSFGDGGEFSCGFPSYDDMFYGVSLQSILTMNPPVFSDFAALPPSSSLAFQNGVPSTVNQTDLDISSENQLLDYARLSQDLFYVPQQEQTCDFLTVHSESGYYNDSFLRLPELSSFDSMVPDSLTHKRLRCGGAVGCNSQTQTVDYSTLVQKNFQTPMLHQNTNSNIGGGDLFDQVLPYENKKRALSSSSLQKRASPDKKKLPEVASVVPQSSLARQRRQKLSDKTRCLQKLLPWDKKMDMATMLEETYKYVKFLQAQIVALKFMPTDSDSAIIDRDCAGNEDRFGWLEKLNRNQALQVLVNSPVAQTLLYSKKCCVFSVEQITLLSSKSLLH